MKSFIKKKAESKLGFRTPDFQRGKRFGSVNTASPRFNPAQFKTQHKG